MTWLEDEIVGDNGWVEGFFFFFFLFLWRARGERIQKERKGGFEGVGGVGDIKSS